MGDGSSRRSVLIFRPHLWVDGMPVRIAGAIGFFAGLVRLRDKNLGNREVTL